MESPLRNTKFSEKHLTLAQSSHMTMLYPQEFSSISLCFGASCKLMAETGFSDYCASVMSHHVCHQVEYISPDSFSMCDIEAGHRGESPAGETQQYSLACLYTRQ